MSMQGWKVAALFVAYAAVGMGGDYGAGLAARALWAGDRHVEGDMEVRVDPDLAVALDLDQEFGGSGECRFEAERSVALDVGDRRALRVVAGSGDLVVEGVAGLSRVEGVARACASSQEDLDALVLTLEGDGADVVLSAHYPERTGRGSWGGNRYARLDLAVHMPLGLDLDVRDSSGGMTVSGTGALRIADSSGGIEVSGVEGSASIDDSSGDIEVRQVRGDVVVNDGSGGLRLSDITGSVEVRDGSGSMDIRDVTRDVIVAGDGSGSISVSEVGGDFRVRGDGSGGIHHDGVAGTVDVPVKKKRNRRGG
jgi:hypothetical protein